MSINTDIKSNGQSSHGQEPVFLTEDELDSIAAERPVALFGAGYYGEKTLNLMKQRPVFCVDNNQAKQGIEWLGLDVKSPDHIRDYLEKEPCAYVVICVEAYRELGGQIKELGLIYGENCAITPLEQDLSILDRLKNHDQTILFSCYDNDGGLYIHDFNTSETKKVHEGPVRGFIRLDDVLYCCSTKGLIEMDASTFEERRRMDIADYDICGITHDPETDLLLIGGTQRDDIIFVDRKSFSIRNRIALSEKSRRFGRESHHINDLVVIGDYILVLMFSRSGWWRYGVFDGGVLEIDKHSGEINKLHTDNMFMPHSLKRYEDHLYVLDSMNGLLIRDLHTTVADFKGFTRGLEIQGGYAYVGQSENRHVSRLKERMNTSIDGGIHIFDLRNHVSRFVHFPGCANIYQILAMD